MHQKSTIPFLLLVFIFGILSFYFRFTYWLYFIVFLLFLLLIFCLWIWGLKVALLFICIFSLVIIRTQVTNQEILPIFLEKDKEIRISGLVIGNPTWYTKSVYFYLLSGKRKIWVKSSVLPEEISQVEKIVQNGNRIQCKGITGITDSPFHTISSHKEYLKRKNACGYLITSPEDMRILQNNKPGFLQSKIDWYRNFFRENLQKVFFDSKVSDFLIAITLGPLSGKSYENEQYSQIGIMHMMAISGTNLMILAIFFLFILTLFSVRTPYKELATLLVLLFYLALIGFIPGAFRSFIMISIVLLACMFKKLYHPFLGICFAGIIILFWNPRLLFDIGFQLSFLGVMAFLLPVSYLSKGFIATFVTSLLVSYQFHMLSLSSLLANCLLIPFLPIFYLVGILCGIGLPFFLWVVSLVTQIWNLFAWLTNRLSLIPFGYRYIPVFPVLFLAIYYGVIFFVLFYQFYRKDSTRFRYFKKVFLVFIMLPFLLFAFPRALDKRVRIDFIDVGQGDSCLIQLPEGLIILIDGGVKDSGVLTLLKQQGINKIDLIILSHYHDDHYGGLLDVIQNIPTVSCLVLPDTKSEDQELFESLYKKLTRKPLRVETICGRKRIVLTTLCRIDFYTPACDVKDLDPENENNRSLVCRFQYGNTSVLFPGDIEEMVETTIIKDSTDTLTSNLLKLPHHGSQTSSTKNFLIAVNPSEAVISSGLKKLFNHPSDSVLERLTEMGINYCITREMGSIQFFSDGRKLTQFYEENP